MHTKLASIVLMEFQFLMTRKGIMGKMRDWSALLDELKHQESLTSDSKLAAALGVTRGYLCAIRKGRKGVSLELAKDILARLGKTFEVENIERLFIPQKVSNHVSYLAAIRKKVILRAGGHCQLCGMEAPFKGLDGTPYLELHHVVPVCEGGSDDISNLVALCPNCNRKIDITQNLEDRETLKKLLEKYS